MGYSEVGQCSECYDASGLQEYKIGTWHAVTTRSRSGERRKKGKMTAPYMSRRKEKRTPKGFRTI